jgi:signal transduction histidine kinase
LKNAQDQIVLSEKMASLGTLSAGIAHEINNPLNFIQGGILAIETYLWENLKEHAEVMSPMIDAINTGVKRSASIVASLNHYSRSNTNLKSDCNVNFIIDNCLTILGIQLKNRVDIKKKYTDSKYILKGNEGNLHQAFLNIISNASQSIDDVGIIEIETNLDANLLSVRVTDNGCGIDKENLDKVFDPFFTTRNPGQGAGLGLSITYRIVKEHNGSIEIFSEVSKGTSVTVSFPIQM